MPQQSKRERKLSTVQRNSRLGGLRVFRPEELVFVAALLLQLVPLLALTHVITVDGPSHVAGAVVLARHSDPDYHAFREYYTISLFPSPNLLAQLVLTWLVQLFSATAAEKLLVGGYVVLLPLSLRYAVRSVNPRASWLAYAAFPFTYNYLLWYGFYNFCYGLALGLFAAGYAVRHRGRWAPGNVLVLSALLLLTYFAHLVPLAMTMLFLGTLTIGDASRGVDAENAGSSYGVRRIGLALAPLALAALPALVLAGAFIARGGAHSEPVRKSFPNLLIGLATLTRPIVSFDKREAALSVLIAATLASLVVLALRQRGWRGLRGTAAPLAAAALLSVMGYFAAPDSLGVQYGLISTRLSFFPVFFLLLWLAAQPTARRVRRVSAAAFLAAAVGLMVLQLPALQQYDRHAAEYDDVARVLARGSTLVALRYSVDRPPRGQVRAYPMDPSVHLASRVAALTAGIDAGHYEAVLNYFPTQFRPGCNLRRRLDPDLNGLEAVPPRVDLLGGDPAGRPVVDYVLVTGFDRAPPEVRHDAATVAVQRQLAERYQLVHTSRPSGLVEVYVRR